MNLLMISGDRSVAAGKPGAFAKTLEGLSKEFERIDVLCPRVAGGKEQTVFGNVHIHPSPTGLLRQAFWIRRKGKDLIHTHRYAVMTVQEYPPFYNGIGAWLLWRKTKTPFCLEIHHIVGWPKAADWKEAVGRWMTRFYLPFMARRASGIRVVNQGAKQVLASFGVPKEKLFVVSSFYLNPDVLHAGTAAKDTDVAFCARLVPNKGLFTFLEAMRLLPERTAVVIGDGPLRKAAEDYCREHRLFERVRFTGWLKEGGQIDELRKAKVLVMCSLSEGGPRVVLEAMACCVPVVATPVGIVPEVIDGTNGLRTTGTPSDIASQVTTLLQDASLRESMCAVARESVLPRFDRSVTLPAYAHFLQSLA